MNSLLSTEDKPVPLEFLINGERLRTSLDDFIGRHGISTETTLQVEYTQGILPPSYQASFPHDDWIGAVDVLSTKSPAATWQSESDILSGRERILTGSYDGCVRVWNPSGQVLAFSRGADPPDDMGNRTMPDGRVPMLHAAKFLSPTSVVASGWPMYLRIWDYPEDENAPPTAGSANLTPKMDLHGHTQRVNNMDVHYSSQQILSASDDCTAMLWNHDPEYKSAPPPNPRTLPRADESLKSAKRRKLSGKSEAYSAPVARGPITTLPAEAKTSRNRGHTRPINAAVFAPHDRTVAYTASDDSTVLTWDLTMSQMVSLRTPQQHENLRSMIGTPAIGTSVVATGSGRGTIYVVDLREDAKTTYARALKGHRNAVASLDTDPQRPWILCSGSHDGCVRGWDLRQEGRPEANQVLGEAATVGAGAKGAFSVFRIPRESNKDCDKTVSGEGAMVSGVCWDASLGIVSGGADKTLQINK